MADKNLEISIGLGADQASAARRLSEESSARPASYLHQAIGSLASTVTSDKETQEKISDYAVGFAKTVGIFMPGRAGYVMSAAIHAVDQASPDSTIAEQGVDLALGAAKGLAMRKVVDVFGTMKLNPATTGMAMGLGNRFAETALSRQTYMDGSGNFSLAATQRNFDRDVFNTAALGVDALSFAAGHGLMKGFERTVGAEIAGRTMYRTIGMSSTFGISTGAIGEIHRQQANGEQFDALGVVKSALIQGTLDGAAGAIGGYRLEAPERGWRNKVKSLTINFGELKPEPNRLTAPQAVTEGLWERNATLGPFKNYADYEANAIEKVDQQTRHYGVGGHSTEVVLRENYAQQLDQNNPDFANRIRPEDIPGLLDSMPDSTLVKRVLLSEKPNVEDDWVSQDYSKGFISAMGIANGDLQTYKTEKTDWLRRDFQHEWSHQMRYQYYEDELAWRFGDATALETDWVAKQYARRNNGEQWAVLGERMLGGSGTEFLEATEKAPVRSVIWMSALKKNLLEDVPTGSPRSPYETDFINRMNYVLTQVKPVALERIKGYEAQPNTAEAGARLRDYITQLEPYQP